MTISYGLGFAKHHTGFMPRRHALLTVRALARAAQVTITDVFEDGVLTIDPSGHITELADDAELVASVKGSGGSVPASFFEYIGGFSICVPGAPNTGPIYLPLGEELHVSPVCAFRDHLDMLIALPDLEPECAAFHHEFRALCDLSERLKVPLVVLGRYTLSLLGRRSVFLTW